MKKNYLMIVLLILPNLIAAGEGPRKSKIYPAGNEPAILLSDSILINSIGKLSYFTTEGKYIKEVKTKYPFARFQPFEKKFVGFGEAVKKQIYYQTVNIYDSELEIKKEIYKRKDWAQEGKTGNKVVDAGGVMVRCFAGKIYIGNRETDIISVYNADGEKINSITYDYEKVKVTQEHKNRYHEYYKTHPFFKSVYDEYKKTFVFPVFFPGIRDFIIDRDGGEIYVLTFMTKGSKSMFVVFDTRGKFLKKVFLPFKDINIRKPCPYTVVSGKFYQLVENEESGSWELFITGIKG